MLYPNDEPEAGKRLRLLQQYFFVTCSLQDILSIHLQRARAAAQSALPDKWAIQLNDTHPSIAVAELMRLLIDEHQLTWDQAWDITVADVRLHQPHPAAGGAGDLAAWRCSARRLPRHLELIYEINERFLEEVRAKFPGDEERVARMSLIGEDGGKRVRMAHLATVGSHSVNGVAALHSELLKASVLKDFYEMWPERFGNVTNGVTPRRFLALSNPGLRELLDETIGDGLDQRTWSRLRGLEAFVDDPAFRQRWREVKRANKSRLAEYVHSTTGIELDPTWMFDVQVKRIHEYKRQHLMALHIITLYHRLKKNPGLSIPPRAFIFGGKAAPGYFMAKRIIKLITAVGATVNNDPDVNRFLKVVFLPNFNVKNAHLVYPAANLSEQISTAGKEASGTGNMKFMINGALTIGTLDGANVEIREEAGRGELLPVRADRETRWWRSRPTGYRPMDYIERDPELAAVLELIAQGTFTHGDTEMLRPVVDNFIHHDSFLALADYRSYVDCQDTCRAAWLERRHLVADVDPQHRAQREVLLGPGDRGVLRRDLGCRPDVGGPSVTLFAPELHSTRKSARGARVDAIPAGPGCPENRWRPARPLCHARGMVDADAFGPTGSSRSSRRRPALSPTRRARRCGRSSGCPRTIRRHGRGR